MRQLGLLDGNGNIDDCEVFDVNKLNGQFLGHVANVRDVSLSDVPNQINADEFSFRCVTRDEVVKSINHIKSNAVGADNISLNFIILLLPVSLPYITFIFNKITVSQQYGKLQKWYRFPRNLALEYLIFVLLVFC